MADIDIFPLDDIFKMLEIPEIFVIVVLFLGYANWTILKLRLKISKTNPIDDIFFISVTGFAWFFKILMSMAIPPMVFKFGCSLCAVFSTVVLIFGIFMLAKFELFAVYNPVGTYNNIRKEIKNRKHLKSKGWLFLVGWISILIIVISGLTFWIYDKQGLLNLTLGILYLVPINYFAIYFYLRSYYTGGSLEVKRKRDEMKKKNTGESKEEVGQEDSKEPKEEKSKDGD